MRDDCTVRKPAAERANVPVMRSRGTSLNDPEALQALNQGQHARAVALLTEAIRHEKGRMARALLYLQLSETHLLEGTREVELARAALDQATALLPGTAHRLEARVYALEIAALQGADAFTVGDRLGRLGVLNSGRLNYHAASALLLVGDSEWALDHLRRAHSLSLPAYLAWRVWSLAGVALEQLGDFELAAGSIRQALSLAPAGELQELERLALADCLLELGDLQAAARELAVVRHDQLQRPEDRLFRLWLLARSEQLLGNPGLALSHYQAALELHLKERPDVGGTPFDQYGLTLSTAQLFTDLGDYANALHNYRTALKLADASQVSLVRHEYAVALIEADQAEEAAAELRLVTADTDYEWQPEALAELADLAFRQGDNAGAEHLARQALEYRPVAAAYLCLGSVAFEYWRLEEAVDWFGKAADAAAAGDPAWLAAQQLLADAYAQMGPDNADRLYLHAQTALKYTDSRNDWYLPLRRHVETARRSLAGGGRLVN